MDLQKRLRLEKGPLQLPREVTKAQAQLRLFVTYLRQPATESALRKVVSDLPREMRRQQMAEMDEAKFEIGSRVGIPHTHDALCYLVARTPQLRALVRLARQIKDENVLPEHAIPSHELMHLCTQVYKKWLEALSRAK